MLRRFVVCALASLLLATAAFAEWESIAPGVDYQRFRHERSSIHVARIDLRNREIRVAATRESQRGMRVSEFARATGAIVAVNGDYFDQKLEPIGLAIGPCGPWEGTRDTRREGVVAVGEGRALIQRQREVMDPPAEWIEAAVSGWPMIVSGCAPMTSKQLPGSDAFTRSPHPRTAAGLSRDRQTMFLVVADGRREAMPGLTLAELATFMHETLGVCSAMNLDGGGSSAMWVDDRIVNRPSDGSERRVANHLAIVYADEYEECEEEETKSTASRSDSSTSSTSPPKNRR